MSESIKDREATVMRIAGNLMSGCPKDWQEDASIRAEVVEAAVATARLIVTETNRTKPPEDRR